MPSKEQMREQEGGGTYIRREQGNLPCKEGHQKGYGDTTCSVDERVLFEVKQSNQDCDWLRKKVREDVSSRAS